MKIKKLHYRLIYLIWTLLISACAGVSEFNPRVGISDVKIFGHVDGQVKSINGSTVEIIVKVPEYDTSTLPFTNKITQRIVSKSFLLENSEATIGNKKAIINEIRKDLLTVQYEKPPVLKVGDKISIAVPKKIIAIADFDVIRGHDKSIGIISMESLTTAIVESGQFNVVERNKLKTVLKELELGASGLTDAQKATKLGKLLQADLILTGTFADMGGFWDANLRLINVSTGLIVSAFEEKASFKEIRPEAVRDTSIDIGNFEASDLKGWLIGHQRRSDGGFFTVAIDSITGANNTKSSLRVDYKLGKHRSIGVENLKNRDWSMYSGVEFYAKSDHNIVINFTLEDENRDNREKRDVWFTQKQITTTWQKYRIDFSEMVLSRREADKKLGGDGIFSLDLIQYY
ncbi:MAG: CsgG/HfaB family protein [Syntrophales bacterium LBB04]|nr:CsgG/HfaB family protein [Syntrophales bacterium LBB04]